MTTDEINKLNENPSSDKVMDFVNAIEKDGYNIINFSTVRELTEIIARGGQEPIKNYNSLKELEAKMSNMDNLTSKFRYETRNTLERIYDLVIKDDKFTEVEKLQGMIKNIKVKLGVIQAVDRVAEAEASRAKTKAAIDALNSNQDLTPEQKNQEFKRLLFTYNGANVRAIANARKISATQEENFHMNLDANFIETLGQDLKGLYDYLMLANLNEGTKKTLIDEFNYVVGIRNEFRGTLAKHNSNLKLYQNTMAALGLSKDPKKNISKKTAPAITSPAKEPEIPIHKMSDRVIYKGLPNSLGGSLTELEIGREYKVIDQQIINGIVYYQLEGMGMELHSSLGFDTVDKSQKQEPITPKAVTPEPENPVQQEENQEPEADLSEEPKRKGHVTHQAPASDFPKIKIGKGAIIARFIANAFITGGLVGTLGPIALIPGILYAYVEYKNYALKKQLNHDLTIMQRIFPFLKKKLINKMEQPETSPEERNKMNDMAEAIDREVDDEQSVKQTISTADEALDAEVKRTQELMEEEGLTREEAVDKTIEQSSPRNIVKPEIMKGV